jgi:hypothetical protein
MLVDAKALAKLLGVSRGFVYEHAAELGAIPLGSGPKARLRFDPEKALERLTACTAGRRSQEPSPASVRGSRRRQAPALGRDVELLPIRRSRPAA